MKYTFVVTAYVYKTVEIEAENENEAIDIIEDEMYDVEFSEQNISFDEREWRLLDD